MHLKIIMGYLLFKGLSFLIHGLFSIKKNTKENDFFIFDFIKNDKRKPNIRKFSQNFIYFKIP